MKLILSRKGFDSSNGGVASPVFTDGSLISLPIPSSADNHAMGDLSFNELNLGEIASQLTRQRVGPTRKVHVDPDLQSMGLPRPPNWRPAFGQSGGAQTHLANNKVGVGDVFVFYGWFRRVEERNGGFQYVRGAPDQHVVFGWLQVGEVWPVVRRRAELLAAHPEQAGHPHVAMPDKYTDPKNTIYIASDQLTLPGGRATGLSGAGVLPRIRDRSILTKEGRSRRYWRLPKWFDPVEGRPPLSHHPATKAWALHDDHVQLTSAAIGQEFVLDTDYYPEAIEWLHNLLAGD